MYDKIVDISSEYLGPAAERFVRRQIAFHLGKEPESLTEDDVPRLAEWLSFSIGVLTEDKAIVEEFSERILTLGVDHEAA